MCTADTNGTSYGTSYGTYGADGTDGTYLWYLLKELHSLAEPQS